MKRIYISGKITGLNIEVAKHYFDGVATIIKQHGHIPVNPFEVAPFHPAHTWEHYMAEDVKALLHCDAIFMLANWGQSKGARVERSIAIELGLPIFYDIDELKVFTDKIKTQKHERVDM